MEDDVAILADGSGAIRFWSEAAERAFGHTPAAAVGQSLDLIVPAEYRAAHWGGFARAIDAGAASVEGEATRFPVQRADGDVVERLGRLTLVRRPEGGVVAAMVVFERSSRPC
jgi:PAS domain S-box-containing protein